MGRRLYLQIYASFLVLMLMCVFGAGLVMVVMHFATGGPVSPHMHAAIEVMVDGLPDEAEARQRFVADRAARLDLSVALYDEAGTVLAAAGEPLPPPRRHHRDHWISSRRGAVLAIALDQGGVLVVAPSSQEGSRLPTHLFILLVAASVMAAGCYPIARRVTRRLESLQIGVEDLGSGDLTARVEVHGSDEVAGLARAFNRSAARIEALIGGQRRVLAGASHELRSPLARLRVAVELVRESPDPAAQTQHLDAAVREVDELDALVGELLLSGRLEALDAAPREAEVDLLALLAEECARHDVTVSGEPVVICGDERLLRHAISNLLDNAVRHGAPPVEASAHPREGGALVVVKDAGSGVAPEDRERIFEPFFRRSSSEGGAGLGLHVVQRVAQLHGGFARCEVGSQGTGTQMVMELGA